MSPELSRPLPLDRIGPAGTEIEVDATPSECSALARRMQLPCVLSFRCQFRLRREPANVVAASGHLVARVIQTCVVSLDDFEAEVEEAFAVRFVPADFAAVDLDPESEDEIPYADGIIDLGEAAAEQLALALDPYPRKPGAELEVADTPEGAHPFAALEALRRRH